MNRAVRRQQTKDSKGGRATGARTALPKTGGARPAARTAGSGGGGGGVLAWRPRFVMDIISELRKVVWPSRDDTLHLAVVVVIVTIIFGALLGAIDIGFGWLIDKTLLK
jgi:preprotein translocase subunit SecE